METRCMEKGKRRSRSGSGRYQIGEIARRTHLSLRTLRYWEEVGLIRPTGRTDGGFRIYSDDELARVRLIRAMKPTDLTIDELRELADVVDVVRNLREQPPNGAPVADAISRLESFISRIRSRCEVLRGRLDDAEASALELEGLIDALASPD